MNFSEITKELLNGKKIRRSCWESEHYWFFNKENKSRLEDSIGDSPIINEKQLQANDWEVVEEIENKINFYESVSVEDAIHCLQEFLESDLWSKFKDRGHFNILRKEIKKFIMNNYGDLRKFKFEGKR